MPYEYDPWCETSVHRMAKTAGFATCLNNKHFYVAYINYLIDKYILFQID